MNVIKERNHFIPKTYLEKFLDKDEKLYIYKKGEIFFNKGIDKKDRLLIVEGRDGLNDIAVKKKLYIPDGDIAEDRNIFEDYFSQEIESKYNDFIAFVDDNFLNANTIFSKYRDFIILLIASMMSRTLHSKMEMEDMYKVNFQIYNRAQFFNPDNIEELKNNLKKEFPEITDIEAEKNIKEYQEMIEQGEFNIKLPRNLFIKHIFQNMEMYSEIISDMTIQILKCDESNHFITSDAPVVYFVPSGKANFYFSQKSLGGPDTELYFPLSKNLCLLLSRQKIEVLSGIPVGDKIVNIINDCVSHNSRNFIFSSKTDQFLEKFIDKYNPYPFKFKMG